jgi:High potential iron-sulfur protein
MNATRRGILISSIGTASSLLVSAIALADGPTIGEIDASARTSGSENLVPRHAAAGVCGSCSFLQGGADDAFASCPMSARASRWQQRTWCSAYLSNV